MEQAVAAAAAAVAAAVAVVVVVVVGGGVAAVAAAEVTPARGAGGWGESHSLMDFKSFLILSVKSAMTLYKLFIQFSPVGTGIGPSSGVIAKGTLLDKRCAGIGPIGKFFA